ncbi:MAG: hypothetical protein Q9218_005117 [Villophora microphyllina]
MAELLSLGESYWKSYLEDLLPHRRKGVTPSPKVEQAPLPHACLKSLHWHFPEKDSQTPHLAIRMSSIEHDHERETAEVSADQTAIDGSVGSDTDTSKPLNPDSTTKDFPDGHHHVRSNSIKKPATFKAVSVTKNFLAKAGTTTAPAVKGPGDNEPSTTPVNNAASIPRPRLVAKPASGHQASASKSSASGFRNGAGSGPDPLQVWNRNRAAPPTAPKHFTDEELKQQYGIHLATRLQADGDGKEAKWADIDDDEDDWAPETIEWNDGTKITLADNAAAAFAEEQAAAQALKEKQAAEAKAKAAQSKPATTVGPNATVLKLGQAAQPKGGLVLKTPVEKPTLVAKPAIPAPVRSPWASIPAVDKVPPVPINPPFQVPQQRPQQMEPQRNELMSPSASAAVEIAADSFSRNQRDTPNAPPGQLFNSQSGQYEPVSTGRRGSVRKDQNFRAPSVLQRPSSSDPRKPAEPSAAFQPTRAGGHPDIGLWTRRGSSAISGDSGPFGRKTSMNKDGDVPRMPEEILRQRRDSQPLRSPALSNQQQLAEPSSAAASPQQQKVLPMGPPATPVANDNIALERERQKKIMLEKRELAIKRKAELEAKEEAEKKERIRIKMEQLGLEPLPKKDTASTSAPPVVSTMKESQPKAKEEVKPNAGEVQTKQTPSPETEQVIPVARSPPKPPVPDASGEPKQYGMMKVHGPPLVNGITGHEAAAVDGKLKQPAQSPEAVLESHQPPRVVTQPPAEIPLVDGDVAVKLPDVPTLQTPERREVQPKPSRQQPWSAFANDVDPYKGWNGNSMTTHSSTGSNLWGPPSNHRALGNGTFDQSVQRPQSRQPPYPEQFKAPAPQPIGPPKPVQRPRQSPETVRAPETTSIPPAEDMQTVPSFPSAELSAKPAASAAAGTPQVPSTQPSSIAPQQHKPATGLATDLSQLLGKRDEKTTLEAWGNFHVTAARDAEEKRREKEQKEAAKLAEEARTGIRQVHSLQPMKETWRQVTDQSGQRETINVTKRQSHQQAPTTQQVNGDLRLPPFGPEPGMMLPSHVGRNSRFFPAHGPGLQGFNPRAVSLPVGFFRQASPPPPDTTSHPAYAGEGRPLVNLPISKPKPTVRLPPSAATPNESPVLAPVNAVPLRAISQPLVNNPSWQDRFNGLLGVVKKPSPEMKFARIADFPASTKIPLDFPTAVASASVSLPPATENPSVKEASKVTSKDVEDEEELFEDRGFGSVPQVSLPAKAPEGVGFVTATKPKRQLRTLKPVESDSKRVFEPDPRENQTGEGLLIYISFPGLDRKSKTLGRGKGQIGAPSSAPSGNQRQQRHASNNQKVSRGPPKPREHYNANKHQHGGSQRNTNNANTGTYPQGNRENHRRDPLPPQWTNEIPYMHNKPSVLV